MRLVSREFLHQICQKGMTLLELMSCVAIIGILASFAIPTVKGFQARARLSEITQHIHVIHRGMKMYVESYGAVLPAIAEVTATDYKTQFRVATTNFISEFPGSLHFDYFLESGPDTYTFKVRNAGITLIECGAQFDPTGIILSKWENIPGGHDLSTYANGICNPAMN